MVGVIGCDSRQSGCAHEDLPSVQLRSAAEAPRARRRGHASGFTKRQGFWPFNARSISRAAVRASVGKLSITQPPICGVMTTLSRS